MAEEPKAKTEPWRPAPGEHWWGWPEYLPEGVTRKTCRRCESKKLTVVRDGEAWNGWQGRDGVALRQKPECVVVNNQQNKEVVNG